MQSLEWLTTYPWARHAMVTGVVVAVTCGVLSVLVVLRRLAFIGQGVSHAGFGGVGLATFLGLTAGIGQDAILAASCLLAAVGIGALSRRGRLEADTAIGVVLVGAMALGVLLTEAAVHLRSVQSPWYLALAGELQERPPGFEQVLFGSLLGVAWTDMWMAIGACATVAAVLALGHRHVLYFGFDPAAARVAGVPVTAVYYLLLMLLAVVIVVAIRVVGVILTSALLVVPGAAALLVTRRLMPAFVLSAAFGGGGAALGLLLSLQIGTISPGPAIVAALLAMFAAAWGINRLRESGEA